MTEGESQLDLFEGAAARAGDALIRYLNDDSPVPVLVKFTRNRVSMASVSFNQPDRVVVRLDEAYARAPEGVWRDLRRYLRTRRRAAWETVAEFARGIQEEGVASRRPRRLRPTRGGNDLAELLREVQNELFDKPVPCRIGWGRRGTAAGKRRRSIRFGSWNRARREIRVHPALDSERVPREFVRYIVYHEVLHGVVPEKRRNGRRYDHTAEFRALERRFPNIEAMEALAAKLVTQL